MAFINRLQSLTQKQAALWLVKSLLSLLIALLIVGTLLIGRILSGPLTVNFAIPYIEHALSDEKTGVSARMDQIVLQWPKLRGPIMLALKNGRVYGAHGELLASIDEAALGISKARLLIGQVAPVSLILQSPTLRIIRTKENTFKIGLDQSPEADTPPLNTKERNPLENVLAVLTHQKTKVQTPSFLDHLKKLEMQQAKVVVDDHVIDMSWSIPRLDARIERGKKETTAKGTIQFAEDTETPPLLTVDATLAWEGGALHVDTFLEHFALSLLASRIPELSALKNHKGLLDARLETDFNAAHTLEKAKFTLLSGVGELNIPELSETPVPFSNMGLLADYDGRTGVLDLKTAELTLNKVVNLAAAGKITIKNRHLDGPLKLSIAHLAQKDISPIWPVALRGDISETWVVHKLSEGTFSNVYAQIDLTGTHAENGPWDISAKNITAGFDFDNMTVDYRAPLKPVTQAKGHGQFDLNSEILRVDVSEGKLLDMDITKGDLEFVNIIEKGKGKADIHLKLKGPLKSTLTYVQDEPIAVKTPIDIEKSAGTTDLTVNLNFPTHPDLKVADVKINVKGTMNDVVLPHIVKDMTLTGGPLTLDIADNLFHVTGKGALENRPVTLDYQEYLNPEKEAFTSKVEADISTDSVFRQRFGADLSSFLEGSVPVKLTYTKYKGGKSVADLSANLTPARIFFTPLAYEKPEGASAQATLQATLENDILKEIKNLKGTGTNLLIDPSTLSFREREGETELAGGHISRFAMDQTIGKLDFTVSAAGKYNLDLKGQFLDFRPFLKEKDPQEPYSNPAIKISLAMDQMRTTDKDVVQYPRITADIDDQGVFNMLNMEGIAGKGPMTIHFKPDNSGKRMFQLDSKDAGAMLKAFGVYNNIIGGEMTVRGTPVKGLLDPNLTGVAEIKNFKVVKAPALARLIGVMSLPGVVQLLDNEGLGFTRLETEFQWDFRRTGSLLTCKNGRTAGNALGLTFEGTYDNASHLMNISGTIIPLSGINKIIGNIPLLGDLITGGTGSLIAATYTMKGPSDKLETSVNPLSVLTPGVLRRILFEEKHP